MDSNFRVNISTSFSILGALDGPETSSKFQRRIGLVVYICNLKNKFHVNHHQNTKNCSIS